MSDIKNYEKEMYGPNGGNWIKTESGFTEVCVFEVNIPPRFRLYFYDSSGKQTALPPSSGITLTTLRLDGIQQSFAFKQQEDDYLEAIEELPEPHEFTFTLEIKSADHVHSYISQFKEENHNHHGLIHSHSHGKHNHYGGKGVWDWLKGKFGHSHSVSDKVDDAMESHELGIKTLKITFIILMCTAIFQLIIVLISGSTALLADTIHNFTDAATSLPLWVAFTLARRGANRKYTYGYGKIEDIAGIVIVFLIFLSACVAGYESIIKLIHQTPIKNLGWVTVAAIIGFIGNEWVAIYRIRVGKQIGSAALVADGYHARVDGFTSLAVLFGVIGVWVGYPIIDPLIGIGITVAILFIVKDATKSVWIRLTDGIEPEILEQIEHAPMHVAGVELVRETRARWVGHRIHAEIIINVKPTLSLKEADAIAKKVERHLHDHLRLLGSAVVRVKPNEKVK